METEKPNQPYTAIIEAEAKDLKKGTFYKLNPRKNAKEHLVSHIEVINGPKWENVIQQGHATEGDIFVMGTCRSKYAGQSILKPTQTVYILSPL